MDVGAIGSVGSMSSVSAMLRMPDNPVRSVNPVQRGGGEEVASAAPQPEESTAPRGVQMPMGPLGHNLDVYA